MDMITIGLLLNFILIIIIIVLIYFLYWYIKPKEPLPRRDWGDLLYSKSGVMRIYENGIQPSRSRMMIGFVPFDTLLGIYRYEYYRNPTTNYVFHFDFGSRKNLKPLGLEGRIFCINASEGEFEEILMILKSKLGNKLDELYKPDRILVFQEQKEFDWHKPMYQYVIIEK